MTPNDKPFQWPPAMTRGCLRATDPRAIAMTERRRQEREQRERVANARDMYFARKSRQ